MKHTLPFLLSILLLPACTTVTETRPDGTVIKTQSVDFNVFSTGTTAVTTLGNAIIASGK